MSTNLPPEVVAEIIRRLCLAFPVLGCSFRPGEMLDGNDVATLLGGIDHDGEVDEVGLLIKMGVLQGTDDGDVEPAEMLRFLEQHGEAWFLARLEMVRVELRKGLQQAKDYEAAREELHDTRIARVS